MPVATGGSSARRSTGSKRHKKKGVSAAAVAANAKSKDVVTSSCQVSRFHTEANEDMAASATVIDLKLVNLAVAGQVLLEDATVNLHPGRVYGLMGRNGAGKTTLLRQLAVPGKLVPQHVRTLLVEQEDVGDARTALQTVVGADAELGALLETEALLQGALDSGDEARAAKALAEVRAGRLRDEAERLGRLVDRTSGARGQAHRMRWIRAEKEAKRAEEAEAEAAKGGSLLREPLSETNESSPPSQSPPGPRGEKEEVQEGEEEEGVATVVEPGKEDDEGGSEGVSELEKASDMLAAVQQEIADSGFGREEAEARAAVILRGLGFGPEESERVPTARLSGGWRMRVALARALFAAPALLMLDEPTNHLDLPAILWLEEWLRGEAATETCVLAVSHDHVFLDAVCTDVVRMAAGRLEYFGDMNYSSFAAATEDRAAAAGREGAALERRRQTLEKSMAEMERKARQAGDDKRLRQVAARRKKLQERFGVEHNAAGRSFKLNRDMAGFHNAARAGVEGPAAEEEIRLSLPSPEPLGYYGPLLQLDGVSMGWSKKGPPVVAGVTLDLNLATRIGIMGRNGTGKSTLINTVSGAIPPVSGDIRRHNTLRVGVFSQHHIDGLEAQAPGGDASGATGVSILQAKHGANEKEARSHLGKFKLSGRLAVQPLKTLSGGQKARLALALLFWEPPHILLLDEPTNHLDAQTVKALGEALEEFDGGVVLISHDRWLLSEVCTDFYCTTRKGALKHLEDGVDQYVGMVARSIERESTQQ